MATFSKPVQASELPEKRKRVPNSILTSEDNLYVQEQAAKRQKNQNPQPSRAKTTTKKKIPEPGPKATSSHQATVPQKTFSRSPSVENVEDEEDHAYHNAGPPRNPRSILEDTSDDEYPIEIEDEPTEIDARDRDEQELGKQKN
jgi:hypothetical protein